MHRVSSRHARHLTTTLRVSPSLSTHAQGDVRHAILTLQLQLVAASSASKPLPKGSSGKGQGSGKKKSKKPQAQGDGKGKGGRGEDKDMYLSGFHAIGKILYAKRALS